MKKLIIAGGSHAEVPVIEAAKAMGWYVISTGNDEGSPGHKAADKYIKGDFSDKEFICELAKKEQVEALISGANDFSYLSVAYTCEKLGLPGHDTYEVAQTIHLKDRFRTLQEELHLRAPKIRRVSNEIDCKNILQELSYPLLVKPVDLTGGKGVKVCRSEKETLAAFRTARSLTRKDYVILEEYIEGSPHGITTLLKNQKVVWHMIDNEQYGKNPYLVLGASAPSDIPQQAEYTLINDIETIAEACMLTDGVFHVQFILTRDGYPVMIDPCRRMPGDLYILLAKYTTGVDYPREIVKAETGEELQDTYPTEHHFVARECIMTDQVGVIREVVIDPQVKQYLIHSYMKENVGIKIDNPLTYKAGILIMQFPSYQEMVRILRSFWELVRIEFEETLKVAV